MTNGGVTETYTYDADGERVAKAVGGASTRYYTFNGQVVAMRDSATNAVTYLHGDHLGSVSLATDSSGAVVSRQDFDPWGKARGTGTIPQTSRNYTGQRLDGTGLLYYHARYYDPGLARFVSADSVVPQAGALTVAPSDATAAALFAEGAKDRRGHPTTPQNPQALNRYSYVQNNPLKYTDPTGHCIFIGLDTIVCAVVGAIIVGALSYIAIDSATRYAREHPVDWNNYYHRADNSDENTVDKPGSAAANLPNLDGKTRAEADAELEQAGFTPKPATPGGYTHWKNPDGSEVVVGPDGKIDRIPNTSDKQNQGTEGPGWRLDANGKVVRPHSFPEEQVK